MNEEAITLTIWDGGGICFQNGDDFKRLREVGFLRPRSTVKPANIKRSPAALTQEYALKRLRVRGLDHYRKLVGNPRSNGPLVKFKRGTMLTMERVPHPFVDGAEWYVVLDTAIGGSVQFIEELARMKRVKIGQGS